MERAEDETDHFILLFAKFPRPGTVKTRLIPRLGQTGATEFARAALIDNLHLYRACRGQLAWCFAPSTAGPECRKLLQDERLEGLVELWPQPDVVDLGERLSTALERAKRSMSKGTVTFVGADCFELDAQRVTDSQEIARDGRASIILAKDGGYVLLCLPSICPTSAFSNIQWSCSTTARQQVQQIERIGLQVMMQPDLLRDVDVPEDLEMFEEAGMRSKLVRTHPRLAKWILDRFQTSEPPHDEPLPAVQP